MKISIKNGFWKKPLKEQRDKLVDIIFWGNVFTVINIGNYLFKGETILLMINLLIFTLYTLIQISYNKRDKNYEWNKRIKSRKNVRPKEE